MPPAMLQANDLQARRGRRTLFTGLNLSLAAGQWLRVAGANGSGKTTLLRMLVGLGAPSAGCVCWCGQPVVAQREAFARELLWLGHAAALKDELSAQENLQSAARLAGDELTATAVRAALAELGLAGRLNLPARVLSAGQRRRVLLAMLVASPARRLWVLDEPFNTLDSAACDWLTQRLQAHVQGGGLLVLTSHQAVQLPAAPPPLECWL
jgi:heme exporter protein A